MMHRALAMAKKGEGRVEPNPMVGCVIVRNGRIIGQGYHRRFGGPHAEIVALESCTRNPCGATVYVSLEPCCHHGKTPPCTDALIQAGVARVVTPLSDPNLAVNGKGLRRLRAAGIMVTVGVLVHEAAEVLAPFLTCVRLGRPYVIAKWAQSLDGQLITPPGESKWISCESSRRTVHRLRARVDAVLVGVGTVLADNPLLTARDVPLPRRALRVVLDGKLRIPMSANVVSSSKITPTLVLTTPQALKTKKARMLLRRGVEVIACASKGGRLVLGDCMSRLSDRGVTNLLVEGGPTVLRAMLDARLVDEALAFVAPRLIGGKPQALCLTEVVAYADSRGTTVRRCGDDLLFRLRLTDPPLTDVHSQRIVRPLKRRSPRRPRRSPPEPAPSARG
jgi:diaminohydroxyphosphoribosylaminopyrimidine deaminase/5-amino-6-(5-phosphoribosylamino)uracil reductase